jgi:Holliday junction DNA helicase RuvA
MIVRLTGILESVGTNTAVLALDAGGGGGVAHELLIPAYLAQRLQAGRMPDSGPEGGVGARMTFHTLQYFEAVGQGTSFIPRTLGFGTPREREFFELITDVKGLGNKRATRALAEEPAQIAAAIAARDVKALQRLPEIGKKLAETIILELRDKIQPMVLTLGGTFDESSPRPQANGYYEPKSGVALSREAEEAVIALTSLGQSRQQAERMVELALQRTPTLATTDEIVSAACAIRL